MKDRFKYKVFDKRDNKLKNIQGFQFSLEFPEQVHILWSNGTYEGNIPLEDMVILQCTGLKDKNGNLIFEGDIVKDDFDDIARVKYSSHFQRLHLFFNLGSRKHLDNYTKCGVHILDWIYPVVSLEVIGNIYEDPELLKGGV